jgi:leader peptidase (prepilin peptidase)/N-methyltransferase
MANDLIGALGVFLFLHAIRLITRKRGMGEGDPPLGFAAALLVGFPAALVELFLAFVGGGAVGAVLVLSGKSKLKDRIAFGPFLVLAVFATLFFGEQIWNWYLSVLGL